MSNRTKEECIMYFKQQRGFDRCFDEMRKKWKSYGKVSGKIKLLSANEEEKRTIGKFLGRVNWKTEWNTEICFSFAEFERALQETRFCEVSIIELLTGYFGEELVANQEINARTEQSRKEFWRRIQVWLAEQGDAYQQPLKWVLRMEESKQHGYAVVLRLWKSEEEQAEILLRNVCDAMALLAARKEESDEEIPLAIMAAKVTGNPHYFDRGQNAALLLLHAICLEKSMEVPQDALGIQSVYWHAGVITDELANTVAVYRIHMQKENSLYSALEEFNKVKESCILSLHNLKNVEKIYAERNRAFVIENEMVFSYIVQQVKDMPVTVVCTSGQLSCAAQNVIKQLCESGTEIYYSGDMDPEGLGIAERMWKKYPHNIHIWRMDCQDYLAGLSEEIIEDWRMNQLQGIENGELKKVAVWMKEVGKAAYQENILELLVEDILKISDIKNL